MRDARFVVQEPDQFIGPAVDVIPELTNPDFWQVLSAIFLVSAPGNLHRFARVGQCPLNLRDKFVVVVITEEVFAFSEKRPKPALSFKAVCDETPSGT